MSDVSLTLEDLKNPQVLRLLFMEDGRDLVDIFKLASYLENNILKKEAKKEHGIYFTPKVLVDLMLTTIELPLMEENFKVVDTSCGIGNILVPFARVYATHKMTYSKKKKRKEDFRFFLRKVYSECVFGIDLNNDFIDIMKAVMSVDCGISIDNLNNFIVNDFFKEKNPFEGIKFNVLLANPPYVTGIKSTVDSDLKGVSNLSFNYLLKSIELLKNNYQMALVMPSIFLNSLSFLEKRKYWIKNRNLNKLWLCSPEARFFGSASINVCVISINSRINLIPQFMTFPDNGTLGVLEGDCSDWSTAYFKKIEVINKLKNEYQVTAGMVVSEAYQCLPHITDNENGAGKKVITSGMVKPFYCSWGQKQKNILKKSFQYPRLEINVLFSKGLNEKILSKRPKLVIPGLIMKIKTFLDLTGEYLPAAGTYVIYHKTDDIETLEKLCRYLNNDKRVHDYLISVLETKRIGQGGYPITKSFLEGIPLEGYND